MTSKKVKLIKADNKLKQKAGGTGEIAIHLVDKAEHTIQNNQVDFSEIALPALSRLRQVVVAVQSQAGGMDMTVLPALINPVMELKANGTMFKYELVSELASTMLSFLEHIEQLDNDAIQIIDAHEKTLSALVAKRMKGHGGAVGAQLCKELEDVCGRYYRKNLDKFKVSPPIKTAPKKPVA